MVELVDKHQPEDTIEDIIGEGNGGVNRDDADGDGVPSEAEVVQYPLEPLS